MTAGFQNNKNEKWNGLKCLIVQLSGGIELAKFWKPKWDFEINHENWKNPTGEETLNSYSRLHILAWQCYKTWILFYWFPTPNVMVTFSSGLVSPFADLKDSS